MSRRKEDVVRLERLLFSNLFAARGLQREGRFREAELLLRRTLGEVGGKMMTQIFDHRSLAGGLRLQNLARLIARAHNVLGEIANDDGRGQDAVSLFLTASRIFSILFEATSLLEDGVSVLFATYNTAVAYQFLGSYTEAERLLRFYLYLFDSLVKEKGQFWPAEKIDDRRADALNGLAVVLLSQRNLSEARTLAQQALVLRDGLPEKKWALAKRVMSLQVFAQICLAEGDLSGSAGFLGRASYLRRKLVKLWGVSPFQSEFYWLKSLLAKCQGESERARRYARKALNCAADEEDRQRALEVLEGLSAR